ncbi:MAG: CCA tRNA nucleotidyltransferase [Candidatus Paracaedibacteraceae bacterium]|nr:CCA tRNA nucleotidyltransferase [Candidatus Paracaedibacteraceae bacterium]
MTIKIPELNNLRQIYKNRGHDIRFVGGCVRDDILGLSINDYDLASTMPATDAVDILKNAGFTVIPTGLSHGTITLIIDHTPYEITTLRKDVSTDGRRATVETTNNWEDDAHRRDFTINALYQDFDGNIYDYSNGLDDLRQGIVRFIGNAEDRIQEDYLRILRYFRFAQRYAKHDLSTELKSLFRTHAPKIQTLSKERITQEFLKIINHARTYSTLLEMQSCGILDQIIPDCDLTTLFNLNKHSRSLELGLSPLRNLAAVYAIPNNLRLSNDQLSYIKRINKLRYDLNKDNIYHAIFNEGKDRTLDALLINGNTDLYKMGQGIEYKALPITSQDLITLGIPAGPQLGQALAVASKLWCSNKFTTTPEEILMHIKTIFLQ